jgi:DNA-binding transcriptional regulator PaaX
VLLLIESTTSMTTTKPLRRIVSSAEPANTCPSKRSTKQSLMLDLLQGEGGVSLAKIVAATGWQPHSIRAALTGLRKQGHPIERSKVGGESRYAIFSGLEQ